jgi:hypothetical protein
LVIQLSSSWTSSDRLSAKASPGKLNVEIMAYLRKRIRGRIYDVDEKALLLMDKAVTSWYLAFALLERGTEREIFPESLLDDWGHEIKSLDLYSWIQKNGIHFPRAEVFGYDRRGNSTQCFLRDLDPLTKYPCYVFEERRQAIFEGVQVVAIGLVDGNAKRPVRTARPSGTDSPLSNAKIHWWRIGPECSKGSILAAIEASS